MLAPSGTTRIRGIMALLAAALVSSLVACALGPGQQVRIRGYLLIEDRTLLVLSEVATPGHETWVASVVESSTSVIVEARTRQTGLTALPRSRQDVWLTVVLQAPVGKREVIDAADSTRVYPWRDFPSM